MEIITATLALIIIVILLALIIGMPKRKEMEQLKNEITTLKSQQLDSANQTLRDQSQFYQSSRSMLNEIHTKLGSLEKASVQMTELGKGIMQLQDILKAPKLRGGLGEYFLEDILKQILPSKNFEMQYRFKTGKTVDAMVKMGEYKVPIDSKFPLESFQRMLQSTNDQEKEKERKVFIKSVKDRIEEITQYIREDENTYNFALMYIPAENIYYEIITNEKQYELSNYSLSRRVIPVSPNTLYSYLMTIVLGLKGLKIEKQAMMIMTELTKIQAQYTEFSQEFNVLGNHLRNAASKYQDTLKKASSLELTLETATNIKTEQ